MFNFFNEISFLIPNFMDLQRKSFINFFKTSLVNEFQKRNPIISKKKKIKILFYPKLYLLIFPQSDSEQAINESRTYSSKLYIPVQK